MTFVYASIMSACLPVCVVFWHICSSCNDFVFVPLRLYFNPRNCIYQPLLTPDISVDAKCMHKSEA